MPKIVAPEHARKFTCCECGRQIVKVFDPFPTFDLCGDCLYLPGWFKDPGARLLIDATHDGKDRCELPA